MLCKRAIKLSRICKHTNVNHLQVLERGYNIQDEVFLHREQRGKIAGIEAVASNDARQWAGAGLEGKIVRRWQSEGSRFDSEAIDAGELKQISPTNNGKNAAVGKM